jgi:hypothetical protein
MGILLAFAPFIVFAVVDRLIGSTAGLLAGAVTSAILLARDWITPDKKPKILEIGTTVLFCGLAIYAFVIQPAWTIIGVRLRVDAGLLIIVLISIIVGRPFTLVGQFPLFAGPTSAGHIPRRNGPNVGALRPSSFGRH